MANIRVNRRRCDEGVEHAEAEQSNQQQPPPAAEPEQLLQLTTEVATPFLRRAWENMNKILKRRRQRQIFTSTSVVFNNTNPKYSWLLPGWYVEERTMVQNGRLYRYYYDPKGKQYSKKHEVIAAWNRPCPFKLETWWMI